MSQVERLQAIAHQVQSLTALFQAAADNGRTRGELITRTLTRIEKNLALHTGAANDGYRILTTRIEANNSRIVQLSRLIDRIRTATTTPNPDPETDTPEKHLLPIRQPSPITIDQTH